MILRFLFLFGGIVMMITGCNSLVSQQYGTHRLQTLAATEVLTQGVGDADFVSITGLRPFSQSVAVEQSGWFGKSCTHLLPLVTPEQKARYAAEGSVAVRVVGWLRTDEGPCQPTVIGSSAGTSAYTGMINTPFGVTSLTERLADGLVLYDPLIFLQLKEEPQKWYWNLLLFVGGVGLALGTEAVAHRRNGKRP